MNFKWTQENLSIAIKLWNENLRTIDIARAIGCSRNSLIGKAHRNPELFPKRKKYDILSWHEAVTLYPHLAGLPRVSSKPKPLVEGTPFYADGYQIPLEKMTAQNCRWPLGDGFCSNEAVRNSSYCKIHTRLSKPA